MALAAAVADAARRAREEAAKAMALDVEKASRSAAAAERNLMRSEALDAAEEHAAASIARVIEKGVPPYVVATALKQHEATLKTIATTEHFSRGASSPSHHTHYHASGRTWTYMDANLIFSRKVSGRSPRRSPPTGSPTPRHAGWSQGARPLSADGPLARHLRSPASTSSALSPSPLKGGLQRFGSAASLVWMPISDGVSVNSAVAAKM